MTYHNRHECKFVVPESVAARVLQRVLPHVEPDPYAAGQANDSYTIASLYLDDERDSLYRETIEGRSHRFKLRVRGYSDDADKPVFLEVKRRADRVVQKMRCPIPRDKLGAALHGDESWADTLPERHRSGMREFVRLAKLRQVTPRCLVRYQRQAYIGRDELDVRVTFDRRLSAALTAAPIVRVADSGYTALATGGVILELKFTDRAPRWLAETIRNGELRRRSFSKYCTAVDALQMARRQSAD